MRVLTRSMVTLLAAASLLVMTSPAEGAPTESKQAPAVQAVVSGKVIVALEPGFEQIAGYDPQGQQLWRTRYQAAGASRGVQALFVIQGRVLLYAGKRVRTVDLLRGKLSGGAKVPYLSTPGVPGCWLNHVNGACAFYCPCRFQFARCSDGAPLGPNFHYHRVCRRNWDGKGSSCGCWGSNGDLVGRGQGTLVARMARPADSRGKRRRHSEILVGLDAATGKERWRRAPAFRSHATWVNGLSRTADRRTCWSGDAEGRLELFECRSGKTLWKTEQPKVGKVTHIGALGSKRGGILISGTKQVICFEERTGKIRWRHDTMGRAATLSRGLRLPRPLTTPRSGRLVVVTPGEGKVIFSLRLTAKATLYAAGPRLVIADGTRLRALSWSGKQRASTTLARGATLTVGQTLVLIRTARGVDTHDLTTLRRLGRIKGAHQVAAVEGGLGPRRAVLTTDAGKGVAPSVKFVSF
jgi:hypothetical protein